MQIIENSNGLPPQWRGRDRDMSPGDQQAGKVVRNNLVDDHSPNAKLDQKPGKPASPSYQEMHAKMLDTLAKEHLEAATKPPSLPNPY